MAALAVGLVAGLVAEALLRLIHLFTNLAFYARFSWDDAPPSLVHWGLATALVPVAGAIVVGVMARFGSSAIRGHGIPEVMDNVLHQESRIPARLMFLKPLSAAIAIGTGGPFGAEGPIIATGGAFGSFVGQLLMTTAEERKTLLAAGAAAGMAATFGSPVSAVLVAVELLLFEYRPRSVIPVSLAACAATVVRIASVGTGPVFPMPEVAELTGAGMGSYALVGGLVGLVAVLVTRAVYVVEDAFERLPIHWMWWPAVGAVAVGIIGVVDPRTLGVGYENIQNILSGAVVGRTLCMLVALKFLSWVIYLGSGTSGGTLAPLFTIGGGLGALLGVVGVAWMPNAGVDPRMAALVGMAAMFAGASHAFLASVVFAFETTRQPMALLPLLAGSGVAYLVSLLLMRTSIMTERLARRGVRVPGEYLADDFARIRVEDVASRPVVTLRADDSVAQVRAWLTHEARGNSHQGFPIVDGDHLIGVLTRRDLLDADLGPTQRLRDLIKRPALVVHPDDSLRDVVDHMVLEEVGRIVVVEREVPTRVVGIVTRSDLLAVSRQRLERERRRERSVSQHRLAVS